MGRSTKRQFEVNATVVVDDERMFVKIDPRVFAGTGFTPESAAVFGDDTLIVNFTKRLVAQADVNGRVEGELTDA